MSLNHAGYDRASHWDQRVSASAFGRYCSARYRHQLIKSFQSHGSALSSKRWFSAQCQLWLYPCILNNYFSNSLTLTLSQLILKEKSLDAVTFFLVLSDDLEYLNNNQIDCIQLLNLVKV